MAYPQHSQQHTLQHAQQHGLQHTFILIIIGKKVRSRPRTRAYARTRTHPRTRARTSPTPRRARRTRSHKGNLNQGGCCSQIQASSAAIGRRSKEAGRDGMLPKGLVSCRKLQKNLEGNEKNTTFAASMGLTSPQATLKNENNKPYKGVCTRIHLREGQMAKLCHMGHSPGGCRGWRGIV